MMLAKPCRDISILKVSIQPSWVNRTSSADHLMLYRMKSLYKTSDVSLMLYELPAMLNTVHWHSYFEGKCYSVTTKCYSVTSVLYSVKTGCISVTTECYSIARVC